jgi:hypothetical protein
MMGVKKLVCCAFVFFLCFLLLRFLSSSQTVEALGGRGGRGGIGRRGGIGHRGYYGGGRGYHGLGRGYYGGGRGYYGGGGYYGATPVYIYDDYDYYRSPYWSRYIPFMNYFY